MYIATYINSSITKTELIENYNNLLKQAYDSIKTDNIVNIQKFIELGSEYSNMCMDFDVFIRDVKKSDFIDDEHKNILVELILTTYPAIQNSIFQIESQLSVRFNPISNNTGLTIAAIRESRETLCSYIQRSINCISISLIFDIASLKSDYLDLFRMSTELIEINADSINSSICRIQNTTKSITESLKYTEALILHTRQI